MKGLVLDKTSSTPLINFNPNSGVLLIEGRSIPENPGDFFDRLVQWAKEYFTNPQKETRCDVKLEYINSGSSKYILGFFKLLNHYHDKGNACSINWHYEEDDESVRDLGEHFKSSLKMPFNMVEYY
jgi:hypothetical protein